jgi:hypothetical protein
MTFTFTCLLYFAICATFLVLISNVFSRKYSASCNNILALCSCIFILVSHSDPDCFCMPNPEQEKATQQQSILLGDRKSDSNDYSLLGTSDSQIDLQKTQEDRLEQRMLECEGAAEFCDSLTVGATLTAASTAASAPPVSGLASQVAAVSQGFSHSFSSTAVDCERALSTTRDTIAALEKSKPS